MDTNNWRPSAPNGGATMDTADWRTQLLLDSRQRIVNKIMETLRQHLPCSGNQGLNELRKIAVRFEEKIYTAASSQSDYLKRISLKMLTMEAKYQNTLPNPGNSSKLPDPGSQSMQSQVHGQGQTIMLPGNQSQTCQQLLPQNIQNNITSTGVQSSVGLPSALPSVSGLTQNPIPNVGQNSNLPNVSGISNTVGNAMGQGMPSNMFANSQRQMQARHQVLPPQQQQQQQYQNLQQLLYQPHQQQFQQQHLIKQKLQQGNLQHSLMQSHTQQQQHQQNLLQPTQLQSSQQSGTQTSSVMQPSSMQSTLVSSFQQNQQSSVQSSTQSVLQKHLQAVLRQQQQPQVAGIHQQQPPVTQQSMMPQQQQQPLLMGQQANGSSMQYDELMGQQNINDLQQQQQQRLLSQQNNLPNLQQQQQQQQQLMAQQNNLSNVHQPQLAWNNIPVLQQQQLLGNQSSNSSLQANQHSLQHMLPQSKVPLQQTQQTGPNLLSNQGQTSQPQAAQQQLMSQMQSQPTQLQQQLGLQQQSNPLPRDMQQRLQASGSLLQQPNLVDQQKQLYQTERAVLETSSTSLDSTSQTGHGGDWQEEVFQKIKSMKDMYLGELNDMYQKITSKVQQHESMPQLSRPEQFDKLKLFKAMLESLITFISVSSKENFTPQYKEKLGAYEKQIVNFLTSYRRRKPAQQGQLPVPHMQPIPQPQYLLSQVQSNDNQMNPQLQSVNMQGSMQTMQQNNLSNLQHNSLTSLPGVSLAQQSMLSSLQPSSNMDLGQGTALTGSLQQNPVSASQQANINILSSQSGVNVLQPNINPLQPNPSMLQPQHLKQEQPMLPSQQLKQLQQRQMQQQHQLYIQKQQLLQQHQLQAKQQIPAQLQTHQMSQLHQMNDVNDIKIREGMGVTPGVFQQHPTGPRPAYPHQHLKPGSQVPISSPQLLQSASPQMPQDYFPHVDQQSLLSSVTKTGTPLQSASSPFVVLSPSTPMAPSSMPGDSEKPISGTSSLSNAGNVGHRPATALQVGSQSLAIGTPGMSAWYGIGLIGFILLTFFLLCILLLLLLPSF